MNDIDLSAYAGGVSGITVFGSFNGNGHIIYGMQGENALFRNNYGRISNLTVEGDMQINSSEFRNVAGIAEYNGGVIEDCISRVNMNSYGVNVRMVPELLLTMMGIFIVVKMRELFPVKQASRQE